MDDYDIVRLYWDRKDEAIQATSEKYGFYCRSIANNILHNEQDAEECVNDTYLGAWNSMPPHWPKQLSVFLGKITRNLSFNRYKQSRTQKRGGGEITLVLDELADCVSDTEDVEQMIHRQELIQSITVFLRNLSSRKQMIFIRRYWYADPVSEIAKTYGIPQASVSKILERTRKQLKTYLIERGFEL